MWYLLIIASFTSPLRFISTFINSYSYSFLTYLDKVSKWLTSNQFTLNITKNTFIIIGSSQRLKKLNSISIANDDKSIAEVSSFSYLGVVINNHLSWRDHIDYISNKVNKKLGLLRRIKSCLPLEARPMFLNSYILPIFD